MEIKLEKVYWSTFYVHQEILKDWLSLLIQQYHFLESIWKNYILKYMHISYVHVYVYLW